MFAAIRQTTPTVLRQCRSEAFSALRSKPVAHFINTPSVPVWMKASNAPQWSGWNFLLSTAQKSIVSEKPISPEQIWSNREEAQVKRLQRPNDAYSGRSVPVINHEVSLALAKLRGTLQANAVRATNVRDERHEKKGEKRNRLKSLRWRRRFAHEVRKKVQLVNEIRARGA
ncbi:hypothetical protein C8Q79DRAFT_1009113 [Trametes meyenii]|nr:hypothetical protein C8Q79DRAFT_1009113 [Trametes meyenii]